MDKICLSVILIRPLKFTGEIFRAPGIFKMVPPDLDIYRTKSANHSNSDTWTQTILFHSKNIEQCNTTTSNDIVINFFLVIKQIGDPSKMIYHRYHCDCRCPSPTPNPEPTPVLGHQQVQCWLQNCKVRHGYLKLSPSITDFQYVSADKKMKSMAGCKIAVSPVHSNSN